MPEVELALPCGGLTRAVGEGLLAIGGSIIDTECFVFDEMSKILMKYQRI